MWRRQVKGGILLSPDPWGEREGKGGVGEKEGRGGGGRRWGVEGGKTREGGGGVLQHRGDERATAYHRWRKREEVEEVEEWKVTMKKVRGFVWRKEQTRGDEGE